MSRSYPADTQIQKFLEEAYNKERDTRLSWYQKSVKDGDQRQSKQFEVFRKKIEAACPKPTEGLMELKHLKPKNYHRRIIKVEDNLSRLASRNSATEQLSVDMCPVRPSVKALLYDGFTKEGKGRYQYLQQRYQRIPENKYQFPVLSSWEYGWRLGDVIQKDEIKKPVNGRTRIVADTFYTRTGIPALQCSATY